MNCQNCPSQPKMKVTFTVPVLNGAARYRVNRCVGCETEMETIEAEARLLVEEKFPTKALNKGRQKRYLFYNRR